jgi:hypothetical protein
MNFLELGDRINDGGRQFKAWFTEFTLIYSPLLIVAGLILTGIDLYLNLGIGNNFWFKLPWSIAQLFAVDGLLFAVWNRILTDEYKWQHTPYHAFLIFLGLCMAGIAIVMNYIIFTQDYMGLRDSVAAMNFIGIPVGLFLFVRSILLVLTAVFAIMLDKVMRSKVRSTRKSSESKPKSTPAQTIVPTPSTTISEDKPAILALPAPSKREAVKSTLEKFIVEGRPFTYQQIADESGASLQTVKMHAPKIKKELGL